ncbi:hypothetical protein DAEQUDRAFT_82038 [Daedalea quercina L-15889]|uniref:Uncharacterized protein n=1 Tax=Daedalea quercina L-15889 TaxID=1314783 RepID=A0A165SHH6_9APHY|nr:hypothetical protein DAEQUDRAFT_82038 [Daedalea quercina L-15889]
MPSKDRSAAQALSSFPALVLRGAGLKSRKGRSLHFEPPASLTPRGLDTPSIQRLCSPAHCPRTRRTSFMSTTMSAPEYFQVPDLNSIHGDQSWMGMDSPYPPTPYRRNTHASNPSWNSFMQPSGYIYPRSSSSRPPPQPTHSRGRSASSQWQSEHALEYTQEPVASEQDETDRDLEAQEGDEEGEEQVEQELAVTEASTDHFTVEGVPEAENGLPEQGHPRQRGKAKAFVGGFVTGLRNLPRLMVKTDHKALKKAAPELYAAHDPEALPGYEEAGQPVPGPSNVQYVEAMEMPSEHVASSQFSYANDDSRNAAVQVSPEHHGEEPPQQGSSMPTRPPLAFPPPVVGSPAVGTPVLVEPRPTRDYAKMESPVRTAPPDDSFSAHITRIHNFLVELKNLPWVSSRVTADYYPEKSNRARDPKIKPGSWYSTRQHHEIDLLATPAALKAEVPRSDDSRSLVRPVRTPTMTSCSTSSPIHPAIRHYAASVASQGLASPVASLRSHARRRSYRSYHGLPPGFQLPHMSQLGNIQLPNGTGLTVDSEGRPVYVIPAMSIPSMPSPPPTSHSPSRPPTNVPYPTSMSLMSSPSNVGEQNKRLSTQV